MNYKILVNKPKYNLTNTESFALNTINAYPLEFIESTNLKMFCENHGFSPTTVHDLSKKIGFKNTKLLKNYITTKYYESLLVSNDTTNKIRYTNKHINNDELVLLNDINEALHNNINNLNWKRINNLIVDIKEAKTVYVINLAHIYHHSLLEIYCNLTNKKIIFLNSIFIYKILKSNLNRNSKSILILVSNGDKIINDWRLEVAQEMNKLKIPIYSFNLIENLWPPFVKSIVLNNFPIHFPRWKKGILFKLTLEHLWTLISHNLFEEIFKRKKEDQKKLNEIT